MYYNVKKTTKKEAMEYLLKDADTNASAKLELNRQYDNTTITIEDINRNKRLFYLISWILNNSRNGKMPQISKLVDSNSNALIGYLVTDNPDNTEWICNLIDDYLVRTGAEDIGIKLNKVGEIK